MSDNQLFALARTVLLAGMVRRGIACEVKQAFQPTQQGANKLPTLYLFKISDHRYGWTEKKDVWNVDTEAFDHTETQIYETVFQVEGLAWQDPADENALTASDLTNEAAGVIAHDLTLLTLQAAGVGLQRITDVRNPYFLNDANRNEAAPSFDFTLTHKRVTVTTGAPVSTYEYDFKRV